MNYLLFLLGVCTGYILYRLVHIDKILISKTGSAGCKHEYDKWTQRNPYSSFQHRSCKNCGFIEEKYI